MSQFENVTVVKQANIYFDGQCISHTVLFSDGSRKTLGVILPSLLRFTTTDSERVEINKGRCRIRLSDTDQWKEYSGGDSFSVPGNSAFDIETLEILDYVCHYG